MEEPEFCSCSRPDMESVLGNIFCHGCGRSLLLPARNDSTLLESTKHFVHKPLINHTDFRLIRLLPGQDSEPVVCEILRFSLEDHPSYEAVSYTWGDQSKTGEIFTQAGSFVVTARCKAALIDLRDPAADSFLWIDSVCINQENNLEKNHQVPLMSTIYSEAERVLIHLGSYCKPELSVLLDKVRCGLPVEGEELQQAATEFLSRPWFSRVWVLQEIAVAKEAVVIVGPERLKWECVALGRLQSLGINVQDRVERVPPVLLQRGRKPFKDPLSLLNAARNCSSTRAHDRIYALLGLLENQDDLRLVPDYNRPVEELFEDITIQIIGAYNHLDIIAEAGAGVNIRGDFRLSTLPGDRRPPTWPLSNFSHHLTQRLEKDRLHESTMRTIIQDFERGNYLPEGTQSYPSLVAQSHWTIMKRLIHKISTPHSANGTETLWPHGARLQKVPLYRSLQISAEAESQEIGVDALYSSALMTTQSSIARRYILTSFRLDSAILRTLFTKVLYLNAVLRAVIDHFDTWESGAKHYGAPATNVLAVWLPSWVPNFTGDRQLHTLSNWRAKDQVVRPLGAPLIRMDARDHGLEVKALKLDRIKLFRPTGAQPDFQSEQYSQREWGSISQTKVLEAMRDIFSHASYRRSPQDATKFFQGRKITITNRSFAVSPVATGPWDVICVLDGASVPFVLKPMDEEAGKFLLVGECYLHGCKGPRAVGDYLDLIGDYRQYFDATTAQELPWETIYLL